MSKHVLVLGAGFGGLELSTTLSEALGDGVEVTLIDRNDAFTFGYSKLDLMFGRTDLAAVRMPYSEISMPGVRFLQEEITEINPEGRRVTTSAGTHEGDMLVIALGADYDMDATPGLAEAGAEFYSVAGAAALTEKIAAFSEGRAVIGVCGHPFKCPPAPSECALLLHDDLTRRGVRDACDITFVIPMGRPVPPSPETSEQLVKAFGERGITLICERHITSLDPDRRVALLDDESELPFDLFLGVPKHRAPEVVIATGMTENGYVPVDPSTLATRYPGVYAVGDVAAANVPKAGVFSEGEARTVAQNLIAEIEGGAPGEYGGRGSCYIEFGQGRVGRVDVDFRSGPKPIGVFTPPSAELVAEKEQFGSSRRARWFGL